MSRRLAVSSDLNGSAALAWTLRSTRLQTANTPGGFYVLLSFDDVAWSAEWRPTNGRMKRLYFRGTAEEAGAACEKHHLEAQTDAFLVQRGAADLVNANTKGESLAWKRSRR